MRSDYEFLTIEVNGHVLEVTINRPDVMNALHPPLMQNLMKSGMNLIKIKIFGLELLLGLVTEPFQQVMILNIKPQEETDQVCLLLDLLA